MPDFRVTFKGDLGNLQQFESAVKNSAVSSSRAIEQANQRVVSSIGKITGPLQSDSGAGLFTQKQRTNIEAYNRTFQHTGEIIRRTITDYNVLGDKAGNFKLDPVFDNAYIASYKQAIGNLDDYEKALRKIARSEKEIMAVRQGTRAEQLGIAQNVYQLQQAKAGTASQLSQLLSSSSDAELLKIAQDKLNLATSGRGFNIGGKLAAKETIEATIKNLQSEINAPKLSDTEVRSADYIPSRQRQIAELGNVLRTPQTTALAPIVANITAEIEYLKRTLAAIGAPLEADIAKTNAEIAQLEARSARLDKAGLRKEAGIRNKNPAYKDLDAAAKAIPPIQKDLATVLTQSRDLRKNLLSGGLGGDAKYGTQEFQAALSKQEASVSRYTENLRTGVKTVQGSFRDLKTGILKDFTADLDENGRVVGRWGGNLRGAGTYIAQTVRNFQKVVQWTIATTAVFSALAGAVAQLQSINQLNTSLARFSITAQASSEQTQQLFGQLSQVAINTATPLKEIITVADDIALATRNANQSTQEWHKSIIDLTTAVGIFTNLTGKDTVTAADQLSSAFKQLDIAPSELISVLNKVTAVAGGQANAIADIVQSVAGLAEAAKAAGFTIDEQIAAVQVLAQVTNKTSAEVATAFKNLFGSVSSVGSEKILGQFGIEIRDAEGGIRDFLDIYRDVASALKQGIIPQNRLPDVLRGIAGGPRRAPDAAALLANIGKIDEVVGRSQNATNEALIANAKILDTNQAKIIQFQNALDIAIFEKFGKAVSDLTSILTDFGISALKTFNGIDSSMLSLVLQLGLFAGGARFLGGILKNILPSFAAFKTGLSGISKGLREVIENQQGIIVASKGLNGANVFRLGKNSKNLEVNGKIYKPGQVLPDDVARAYGVGPVQRGRLALGKVGPVGRAGLIAGAVGGLAVAQKATEAFDQQTLGTILQAGGALVTLIPGLQGVGIAAVLAGTGLAAMASDTNKVIKTQAELSSEIFTLTQAIQTIQQEAAGYEKVQQEALKTIQELQNKTGKTADEQLRLSDATGVYATATLALAAANREVASTFDEILGKIPELADKYDKFKTLISTGGLSPSDPFIKELQQRLAADILKNSGQPIYGGGTLPIVDVTQGRQTGTPITGPLRGAFGKEIELSDLVSNPALLRDLFHLNPELKGSAPDLRDRSPNYGRIAGINPDIAPPPENVVQALRDALTTLIAEGGGGLSEEDINLLVKAISELSAAASPFQQNISALAQQNAVIQSKILTGEFRGEKAQNATLGNAIATEIAKAQSMYQPPAPQISSNIPGRPDPQLVESAGLLKTFSEASVKGLDLTNTQLVIAAESVLKLRGEYAELAIAGDEALNRGILDYLRSIGVEQAVIDELAKAYNLTLAQTVATNEELIASLDKAKTGAKQAYADRAIQLEIAENSGQFEKNGQGLAVLKAQNEEAYKSTIRLIDSIGVLDKVAFVELNNTLANVIGLQGLFISDTQASSFEVGELEERMGALAAQLIENAVAAGVNAEGIKKVEAEAAKLIALITAIPPYKQVIIDIQTVYTTRGSREGGFSVSPALQQQYNQAVADQKRGDEQQAKEAQKIIDRVNSLIRSGTGSNLGQLPKTPTTAKAAAPYNKPGLLDIPEEIIDASNTSQLLQQAIKNAKNLQSKIPGETKANKGEIVELLNGTKRVLETRGIGEEYLRRAMDELTGEIKRQNDLLSKADTIRRIRVQTGGFASIANVPINSQSGVSVGGPQGPISISLDVNGTVLTPAQFAQFADMIGASIKRQISA